LASFDAELAHDQLDGVAPDADATAMQKLSPDAVGAVCAVGGLVDVDDL
jgi:hypothetical protein